MPKGTWPPAEDPKPDRLSEAVTLFCVMGAFWFFFDTIQTLAEFIVLVVGGSR